MGHALMENRNGLIVGAVATRVSGHAGRLAAVALIQPQAERAPVTLGSDKGYDSADFVIEPREARVTPHVAQHKNSRRARRSTSAPPGIPMRSRAHPQTHRGRVRLGQDGGRAAQDTAPRAGQGRLAIHPGDGPYDLVRLPKLLAQTDIAKSVFQVHGEDAEGRVVVQKRRRRSQVAGFFAKLPPARIGIEACGSAPYWARELSALGHEVRLIPAAYVKPFVRRNKTDARDAWAFSPRA